MNKRQLKIHIARVNSTANSEAKKRAKEQKDAFMKIQEALNSAA